MANEVATNGARSHIEISPWEAYANEQGASAIAGDILKFKKGKWTRGQDDVVVTSKAKFLCNMIEIWRGWQKWEDGKPVDHRLVRITDGPRPQRNELGDLNIPEEDDPWQMSDRMVMRDSDGGLLTFCTSSNGGRGALADLSKMFAKEMKTHPGQFPVVTVDVSSFESKKYGEVASPAFKVVGWDHWDEKSADFQPAIEERTIVKLAKEGKYAELDDEIPFEMSWR